MDDREAWIDGALEELRAAGLERRLRVLPGVGGKIRIGGRDVLNFSSNDYLDLAGIRGRRTGRRPSRSSGRDRRHRASSPGPSRSTRSSSGASPPGRAGRRPSSRERVPGERRRHPRPGRPGDLVLADRLAHASLIDAAVLSRAHLRRFRHNDPGSLEEILRAAPAAGRRLVVTESVFSMDGDVAPLREIAAIAARHGALLLVDEATRRGSSAPPGAASSEPRGSRRW